MKGYVNSRGTAHLARFAPRYTGTSGGEPVHFVYPACGASGYQVVEDDHVPMDDQDVKPCQRRGCMGR